jgi:hypothetical protein
MTTPAAFADDDDDDRYGAYVYAGTVEAIDDATVVDDIGELERDDDDNLRAWELIGNGQDVPSELYFEDEDLEDDVSLDDLTGESHLIVVHESDDTDSPIIAVGVIEGDVDENGGILIQLEEHDASGFEGRAWVGPELDDDDDDDDVDIVVGIYPAGDVEPLGTPAAVG